MLQEPNFHREAAAVADQSAVFPDDAVAGNDDRNRVSSDRTTDRLS